MSRIVSIKEAVLHWIDGLYTEVTLTDEIKDDIYNEVDSIPDDTYCLVEFPDVQKYQNEEWFNEEAHPAVDIDGAYFIPTNRVHYAEIYG